MKDHKIAQQVAERTVGAKAPIKFDIHVTIPMTVQVVKGLDDPQYPGGYLLNCDIEGAEQRVKEEVMAQLNDAGIKVTQQHISSYNAIQIPDGFINPTKSKR